MIQSECGFVLANVFCCTVIIGAVAMATITERKRIQPFPFCVMTKRRKPMTAGAYYQMFITRFKLCRLRNRSDS